MATLCSVLATAIEHPNQSAMKILKLSPNYVDHFPDKLEEGVLYISEEFSLTGHKCCCGCGEDVYLKLGPAKWQLTKMSNGTVSLDPSVGNWKYECQSHYWICKNQVLDAGPMSASEIAAVQQKDRRDRNEYLAQMTDRPHHLYRLWQSIRNIVSLGFRWIRSLWPW